MSRTTVGTQQTSQWQPNSGGVTRMGINPVGQLSAAQLASVAPKVRPGYELQGPYNSMQQAAAKGLPYLSRAELLAKLGGTPIAPAQTGASAGTIALPFGGTLNLAALQAAAAQNTAANPAAPSPFMGVNPYGAQYPARATTTAAAPTGMPTLTPQQQAQMAQLASMTPGMGINPALIAAYQASQAGQGPSGPPSALYNFLTPQQMAARMGLLGMNPASQPVGVRPAMNNGMGADMGRVNGTTLNKPANIVS